jgi:hypothetical protein
MWPFRGYKQCIFFSMNFKHEKNWNVTTTEKCMACTVKYISLSKEFESLLTLHKNNSLR